jgi:hypothetical protein
VCDAGRELSDRFELLRELQLVLGRVALAHASVDQRPRIALTGERLMEHHRDQQRQ